MYTKEIEERKKKLKLTKRQKEILVGTLLGDSTLETGNGGKTYRLKVEHAFGQKAYVDWLYEAFKDWVRTPPQVRFAQRLGTVYKKYWFSTLSHGILRFYAHQFYDRELKHKTVPRFINRWLTPLALAVWFMDDGSIKSSLHKARIINTQGFTKEDIEKLRRVLTDKYALKTSVRKQKDGHQIMILAESAVQFMHLTRRHMHPSMMYKLQGLG